MKHLVFPVQFVPEKGGGYYATCPALPGCHSQGDTLDEARANIREAIELTLEDLIAHGETPPDPSTIEHDTISVAV